MFYCQRHNNNIGGRKSVPSFIPPVPLQVNNLSGSIFSFFLDGITRSQKGHWKVGPMIGRRRQQQQRQKFPFTREYFRTVGWRGRPGFFVSSSQTSSSTEIARARGSSSRPIAAPEAVLLQQNDAASLPTGLKVIYNEG